MPLKGVILAAGDGGRLLPITLKTPKVLLEVAGRPIIQYPLEALHASGVDNIAVVVGYKSEAIIDHLERGSSEVPTPTFVMNPIIRVKTPYRYGQHESLWGTTPSFSAWVTISSTLGSSLDY